MAANFNHLINIIFGTKGAPQAKAAIKGVAKETKNIEKTAGKAGKKMGDFSRALRRAAIVAPVWLLLRNAMMSFLRGFSEGFKLMEEFDRAMIKAQSVVHGAVGNMAATITDLKSRIRALSQETGESLKIITSAFFRFGTLGLEVDEAWQGAESSVRFAMATMGDADRIARTMAFAFNLLGDSIDSTIPAHKRMETQLAKMFSLYKINAFESNEFAETLIKFLPTANSLNVSMDETIALLGAVNSAALLAGRGGRLLGTGFIKMIENADKFSNVLGMGVNPATESTFDVFKKVIKAISDLSQESKNIPEVNKIISEVFGGVRGGTAIRAIVSVSDLLNTNLEITTKKYSELGEVLDIYEKRNEEVTKSMSRQLQIFRNLRTQVFEQFIVGTLNAKDYADALFEVNKGMVTLSKSALVLGESINKSFKSGTGIFDMLLTGGVSGNIVTTELQKVLDILELIPLIRQGAKGDLGIGGLESLIPLVEKSGGLIAKLPKETVKNLREVLESLKLQKTAEENILKIGKNITSEKKKEFRVIDNFLRKLQLQEESLEDQLAILKLQGEAFSKADIAVAEIALEVSKMVDEYNSLQEVINGTVSPLNKQVVLTDVLSENFEKVKNSLTIFADKEKRVLALSKLLNSVELERQKILNRQKDTFADIAAQYERASNFERTRLRRLLKLLNLPAADLAARFSSAFDKQIILDYWNTFSEQGKLAVAKVITNMRGLPSAQAPIELNKSNAARRLKGTGLVDTSPVPQPQKAVTQITNVGAGQINVNVESTGVAPEEMISEINKQLRKELIENDAFISVFVRNIREKL